VKTYPAGTNGNGANTSSDYTGAYFLPFIIQLMEPLTMQMEALLVYRVHSLAITVISLILLPN
jgi:hypothetical protein